jgi:hypothetical protein
MEYALTSDEYNDVIFLGDSAPLHAIDPVYFETLTGLRAYNLASFRPVSVYGQGFQGVRVRRKFHEFPPMRQFGRRQGCCWIQSFERLWRNGHFA